MLTREERKIVAVGDGGVGKTALLVSYANNTFPTCYIPTVFDNYTAGTEFKGKQFFVSIWDTAGQEEYSRLRILSYPETDVFLICFDVTNRDSFSNVLSWFVEVKRNVPDSKTLIVGTQIDKRKNHVNAFTKEDGQLLTKTLGADAYAECSALTREGVSEVFDLALALTEHQPTRKIFKHKGCSLL